MRTSGRGGDLLLWASLAAALAIVGLTVVALWLAPVAPPPAGSLPRMRGPVEPLGPGTLLRSLGVGSLTWYVSILAAPLFVWLSRRFPLDRGRWVQGAGVMAAVILALVLGTAVLQYRLAYGGAALAPQLGTYLRVALPTGLLPFLAVATLAQALDARTRAHERALEAADARNQLTAARLEALTARLQPHFLFNTLQGISTLIHSDPAAADRMLARLSDLLREVLARRDRREVTLEDELRVLDAYVDLARMRYGPRLRIGIEAGADARRAAVPFFLLQPLVENALHHGVGSRAGPGGVHVRAERVEDRLRLTVSDDGPGAEPQAIRQGVGLGDTGARLEGLYGAAHTFVYGPAPEGGFRVHVEIPWRETGAP